jgi:deazaflavin-dependent oxidoreductase (nitroreductase family)
MAVGEPFLYLVTRGRKSGQPREIEIWFVAHGGRHYIVAEHREDAAWVKNLRAHREVSFSVGSRGKRDSLVPRTPAVARVVDDGTEAALAGRVRQLMQDKYGWSDGLVVEIVPSP